MKISNSVEFGFVFAFVLLLHLHKVWPMDPWIPISKWDFLLISYLASSNFKELSNLQILIFQSRGGCVIKLKICYCVTCLKLKIHTSEKSEIFFRKKNQPSELNYQMQSFCQSKVDLNYQLFLTSSIKMIIDKNHAMLWSFVTPFIWWMMGFLCVPSHSLLFCSYFLRDYYTRPLAKNKDVLSRAYALLFAQYGVWPTFGSARIDPWIRSCER